MTSQRRDRILCVDDEPQILEGLKLHLRNHYEVVTAVGGKAGLEALDGGAPFAVVISDMRMPQMDGATFLGLVRQCAPDTVRILLTGHSDIDSAIAAVNEGQIFRFMTKPCPPGVLLKAVQAGAKQFHLVVSERVLLEDTLQGSIRMLADILALISPWAFGRAMRAKRHVTELADHLGVRDRWSVEVAALLSQVGCVTLPTATVEKLYNGSVLTGGELAMVSRLPEFSDDLLANIPRLEPVREILQLCPRRYDGGGALHGLSGDGIPLGARILKVVLDFDALEAQGYAREEALETMRARDGWYDPGILSALLLLKARTDEATEIRDLRIDQLQAGMVFFRDVPASGGKGLLVARGQEANASVIERLKNLAESGEVAGPFRVVLRRGLEAAAAPAGAGAAART